MGRYYKTKHCFSIHNSSNSSVSLCYAVYEKHCRSWSHKLKSLILSTMHNAVHNAQCAHLFNCAESSSTSGKSTGKQQAQESMLERKVKRGWWSLIIPGAALPAIPELGGFEGKNSPSQTRRDQRAKVPSSQKWTRHAKVCRRRQNWRENIQKWNCAKVDTRTTERAIV